MTIHHMNGTTELAVILSRTGNRLRVVVSGADDAVEFTNIHGVWVSQDCEPVTIEYEWEKRTTPDVISESDCVCSPALAAHLIHLLEADELTPLSATAGLIS